MSSITILVGIPASGKTTWVKRVMNADLFDVVVSSDAIREELTGDMTVQDRNAEVFRLLDVRVKQALNDDKNVVVDATNLKPYHRKKMAELAGVPATTGYAIWFSDSLNYELCQTRNLTRDDRSIPVPEEVMRRFHAAFLENCKIETLNSEGWHVIELKPDHLDTSWRD